MGISNSTLQSLESSTKSDGGPSQGNLKSCNRVVTELKAMKIDGWVPRGVIRCQEQSGGADPMNVHGYTIVKCTNQDAVKYLRLDFCANGLFLREGETDGDFKNASGIENEWTTSILSTAGWGAGMAAVACAGPVTAGVMAGAKGIMLIIKASGKAIMYHDCKKGATLEDIYTYVEEHKSEPYDLSTWNCNNFADGLYKKLLN